MFDSGSGSKRNTQNPAGVHSGNPDPVPPLAGCTLGRDAQQSDPSGCTKGRAGGLQKTANCRTGRASGLQKTAAYIYVPAGCRKGRAVQYKSGLC